MIIARDRRQARVIKRFVSGLLHEVDMLRPTRRVPLQNTAHSSKSIWMVAIPGLIAASTSISTNLFWHTGYSRTAAWN